MHFHCKCTGDILSYQDDKPGPFNAGLQAPGFQDGLIQINFMAFHDRGAFFFSDILLIRTAYL